MSCKMACSSASCTSFRCVTVYLIFHYYVLNFSYFHFDVKIFSEEERHMLLVVFRSKQSDAVLDCVGHTSYG
jgi:hypothetical protein